MRLFIFVTLFTSIFAFPKLPVDNYISEESVPQLDAVAAVDYLDTFGYISKRHARKSKLSGMIDVKTYSKGLKEFQRMAGLKPTARLDEETAKVMSMPRCGVEDTIGAFMMGSDGNHADSKFRNKKQRRIERRMARLSHSANEERSRSKRYNLEGGRWNKKVLKYHILNYTPDMTRSKVQISIKKALDLWANHTNLKFVATNNVNDADLKIEFVSGKHGDAYPFDGPGGTLGHAFFPPDGSVHFDDAEHFTFEENQGTNLFTVAAHVFGHSLGLGHSSVTNSLMAPFYRGYQSDFTLSPDDIAAIQQLYGKKDTTENGMHRSSEANPKTTSEE